MSKQVKPFYKSRTFWVNALMLALAIISVTDPKLFGFNPGHIAWLTAVLNIVLRFLTTGAVSLTGVVSQSGEQSAGASAK